MSLEYAAGRGGAGGELSSIHHVPSITAEEFGLFRTLIHRETGISLRDTKRALIVARMAKRLRELGYETYSEYYHLLSKNDPGRDELRRMINMITTNKTSFFRESHHFDFLREVWVPELQRQAAAGGPRRLRIWSAACSTGQEPYSIAMTVRQALGPCFPAWDCRILASDIDTDVLAEAEEGVYSLDAVESVPLELRSKLFMRGIGNREGLVQVRPEIRSLVTFRRINFVEPGWPIHTSFDAIFCRNAMIYFERATQRDLTERMLRLLKPTGYFFAGHSENLLWLTDRLASVNQTIYRLKNGIVQ